MIRYLNDNFRIDEIHIQVIGGKWNNRKRITNILRDSKNNSPAAN